MWFFWAVMAIVVGGVHAFILKVAVEKKYDSVLISSVTPLVSACFGTAVLWVMGSTFEPSLFFIEMAIISAVLFIITSVLRQEGLSKIDTTIYFPINKTVSTSVAAFIGIFLLNESLTGLQYVGVLLGIIVPLLLMNRSEHARQKNIILGVQLATTTAVLSTIAQMVNSFGVSKEIFDGSILFLVLIHIFTALFGLSYFWVRQGSKKFGEQFRANFNTPSQQGFVLLASLVHFFAFFSLLMAFSSGYFSVVYTITSLGIVVPIVLSILVYKEHWDRRKVLALVLAIASVGLLK